MSPVISFAVRVCGYRNDEPETIKVLIGHGLPRNHDIANSWSNDLTVRHAADKILAEKTQTHIVTFDFRWESCQKTRRGGVLPILLILGILRFLIGRATSVAKAANDREAVQRLFFLKRCYVTIVPWMAADCISLCTNEDEESIQGRYKTIDVKNATRRNY